MVLPHEKIITLVSSGVGPTLDWMTKWHSGELVSPDHVKRCEGFWIYLQVPESFISGHLR